MRIDITKDGMTNTVALVNFANPGINLSVDKVAFDTVTAELSNDGKHNTKARLYAQEGKGLEGQVFITYTRPGLLEQTDSPSLEHTAPESLTPAQLLAQLCAALELLVDEVEWRTYTPGAAGETTISILAAKPLSLLYQGEVALTIVWSSIDN